MKHIPPEKLDTAFVPPGTPTFAGLMDRIAAEPDLSHRRRRDLLSALRRTAKALGRSPALVPADARWLQPRLSKIVPAALDLSPKSWSNVLSDVRAAMFLAGIVTRRINRRRDLSPDWRRLWEAVLASEDRGLRTMLCSFVYFMDGQGVRPHEVREHHALAYRDALVMNEIRRPPETSYRAAVSMWNLAIERIPDWPRHRLVRTSRAVRIVRLPLENFPAGFADDLDRYLDRQANPSLFDPDDRLHALSPATLAAYRQKLRFFASALVHAGVPIEEIENLADLVDPVKAERGLQWMYDRDGKKTTGLSDMATLLRGVARRYVRLPDEAQERLDFLVSRTAMPARKGLTDKNRARLRPLNDEQTLERLLLLPERLFDRAETGPGDGQVHQSCLLRETALAIAILLYCPVRIGNLASIHLERHLQRPRDGRVFLCFPANEVKNGQALEAELPATLVGMIDRHVETRAPALCPVETPWLFPKRAGDVPMHPGQLSRAVFRRFRTETGLEMNVHLFRHLAAMIWLQANPGAYEAVRRLLGHARLSRTLDVYAGFETETVSRLFGELISKGREV